MSGRPRFVVEAAAGALLVVLLVELARRVAFPWDFLIRFESGFMTDILKIHNGRPLFGDPADLNNAVYAPAQELLTWLALTPFGRALDVRFCRLVAVAIGFAAAAVAAWHSARGRSRWLAFATASLLVFRGYTADAPHPEHLRALHLVVLLALCERAVAAGVLLPALVALVVGALGVFAGLESALAPFGVLAALIDARRWRSRQTVALVSCAVVSSAAAVGSLLASPDARFFVLHVLLRRAFEAPKFWDLLVLARGHLLVLAVLALACAPHVRERGRADGRRFVVVWVCLGAAIVLPSVAAFAAGVSDGDPFELVGLWLLLLVWPCLAGRWADDRPGPFALGAVAVLLVVLAPLRLPPPETAYRWGESLDAAIAHDVQAGSGPLLLATGTMPLVHNGMTAVPLDRADALALVWNQAPVVRGFHARLAAGHYARIYSNTPGYEGAARGELYRPTGVVAPRPRIPAIDGQRAKRFLVGYDPLEFGWEAAMYDVTVLEPTR